MRCGAVVQLMCYMVPCLQGSICLPGRLHGCRLRQIDRSARAVEAVVAVVGGRAIATIVASGSRPAPETPLKQRAVERALCSDQSGHARGQITRGEALICTTDECHGAKSAAV